MKPEVTPATAPPDTPALPDNENDAHSPVSSQSDQPSRLPPSARQRRLPSLLVAMLVVYGLWLGWLAYVALINVRAGNQ